MPKELSPLEKLQLLVPGYRGYKVKDLIRKDDLLVRQAVSYTHLTLPTIYSV